MTHNNAWKTALGVIAAGAMAFTVAMPANATTTTSEQTNTNSISTTQTQSAQEAPKAQESQTSRVSPSDAADFPGTPGPIEAKDSTTDFASVDGLKDANGNPIAADANGTAKIEAAQGSFNAVKVDASAAGAKFAIRTANKDAQINAGTVLYIPVTYDAKGVSVKIAASQGNTAIDVDGAAHTTNEAVAVADTNTADFPKYVKVTFTAANYATAIVVDYASDSGYGTPDVQAKDRTYTFNASNAALLKDANGNAIDAANPTVQGAKGSFDDIKIDATSGKVYLRAEDTQVNGGTTLYLPVAADAQGVSVTVQGTNNANLGLQLDGADIAVGKATAVSPADGARYVPLSFIGTGSFYLTTISVDYGSDTPAATTRTVTVGKGSEYQYQTIQSALDANESSLTDRLTLKIAPGDYQEQVTVTKPGVVFRNADETAKQAVTIHEAYYAAMGDVTPDKDAKYDKAHAAGTNTSGTVLVKADGFSAYGITFQNDFNITTHPEEGSQTPAVAFYSSADKVNLVNCRMIGRQDTVWFNGNGRVNVANSYIEGTVDFVFGSADAYIHDTTLHMAHFAGKDNGYFTAPNTNKDHVGLVFDKCVFTVDTGNTKATLGRPWQTEVKQVTDASGNITGYDFTQQETGKYPVGASSATTLLESKVSGVKATVTSGGQKIDVRWSTWSRKLNGTNVDVSYHPAVRFVEYNSTDENGTAAPTYDYTVADNAQRKEFLVGKGVAVSADQLGGVRADLLAKMGIGTGAGKWDPSTDGGSTPDPDPKPDPEKTAVSVAAPADVTTRAGLAPVLPATAVVTWSDGSATDEPVTWVTVPAESYAKPGSFTVAGKAAGLDVTVTVIVEAAPKTAVSVVAPAGVTTQAGTAPKLPATAKVTWSDNSVTDEPVTWDVVPAESYVKAGSFDVKGKTAGLDVTVHVTVKATQPDPDPKPDPNTPRGAIRDYWLANGGASGWLGKPTGAELAVKGGASQTFQGGTVFWSSSTGAHGVKGGVLSEYASLKWEQGKLGFPTSDENALRGGASQVFQNGQIHWTGSTGAHATFGAIQGYWSGLGWENGWLGYPTGDELSVKGGVSQTFQGGTVFWKRASGQTHGVRGGILGKYADLKWEQGKLGFPVSDENTGLRNGGASQVFEHGQIHWSPATGAYSTLGAIQDYWQSTGWENGWLGYPTSDEINDPLKKGEVYQNYQGGQIHWKSSDGSIYTSSFVQ